MQTKLDIKEHGHFVITNENGEEFLVYPKTFKQLVDIISSHKVQKIAKSVYEAAEHTKDWRVLALSNQLIILNEILASKRLEDQDPKYIN